MNAIAEPVRLEPHDIEARPAQPLVVQQQTAPVTVEQVLAKAAMSGVSVEQMASMLALAERMQALRVEEERQRRDREAHDAKLAFRRDFTGFRSENIIIPKTRHVDRGRGGSFDQAEYEVVVGRLSPALAKHGFGIRHDQKFTSRKWVTDGVESDIPWVVVTCFLEHKDGHTETLTLEGPPGDLSVNTPTQNMQVTGSYLKRQSVLAITGTPTGGEDDERGMRKSGAAEADDAAAGGVEGRMKAATSVQELAKIMSGLSPAEKRQHVDYFNVRTREFKEAGRA